MERVRGIGGVFFRAINFCVPDLDAMLEQLRTAGVEIDERREEYDYGRFGWFADPEGNRVELWQPA